MWKNALKKKRLRPPQVDSAPEEVVTTDTNYLADKLMNAAAALSASHEKLKSKIPSLTQGSPTPVISQLPPHPHDSSTITHAPEFFPSPGCTIDQVSIQGTVMRRPTAVESTTDELEELFAAESLASSHHSASNIYATPARTSSIVPSEESVHELHSIAESNGMEDTPVENVAYPTEAPNPLTPDDTKPSTPDAILTNSDTAPTTLTPKASQEVLGEMSPKSIPRGHKGMSSADTIVVDIDRTDTPSPNKNNTPKTLSNLGYSAIVLNVANSPEHAGDALLATLKPYESSESGESGHDEDAEHAGDALLPTLKPYESSESGHDEDAEQAPKEHEDLQDNNSSASTIVDQGESTAVHVQDTSTEFSDNDADVPSEEAPSVDLYDTDDVELDVKDTESVEEDGDDVPLAVSLSSRKSPVPHESVNSVHDGDISDDNTTLHLQKLALHASRATSERSEPSELGAASRATSVAASVGAPATSHSDHRDHEHHDNRDDEVANNAQQSPQPKGHPRLTQRPHEIGINERLHQLRGSTLSAGSSPILSTEFMGSARRDSDITYIPRSPVASSALPPTSQPPEVPSSTSPSSSSSPLASAASMLRKLAPRRTRGHIKKTSTKRSTVSSGTTTTTRKPRLLQMFIPTSRRNTTQSFVAEAPEPRECEPTSLPDKRRARQSLPADAAAALARLLSSEPIALPSHANVAAPHSGATRLHTVERKAVLVPERPRSTLSGGADDIDAVNDTHLDSDANSNVDVAISTGAEADTRKVSAASHRRIRSHHIVVEDASPVRSVSAAANDNTVAENTQTKLPFKPMALSTHLSSHGAVTPSSQADSRSPSSAMSSAVGCSRAVSAVAAPADDGASLVARSACSLDGYLERLPAGAGPGAFSSRKRSSNLASRTHSLLRTPRLSPPPSWSLQTHASAPSSPLRSSPSPRPSLQPFRAARRFSPFATRSLMSRSYNGRSIPRPSSAQLPSTSHHIDIESSNVVDISRDDATLNLTRSSSRNGSLDAAYAPSIAPSSWQTRSAPLFPAAIDYEPPVAGKRRCYVASSISTSTSPSSVGQQSSIAPPWRSKPLPAGPPVMMSSASAASSLPSEIPSAYAMYRDLPSISATSVHAKEQSPPPAPVPAKRTSLLASDATMQKPAAPTTTPQAASTGGARLRRILALAKIVTRRGGRRAASLSADSIEPHQSTPSRNDIDMALPCVSGRRVDGNSDGDNDGLLSEVLSCIASADAQRSSAPVSSKHDAEIAQRVLHFQSYIDESFKLGSSDAEPNGSILALSSPAAGNEDDADDRTLHDVNSGNLDTEKEITSHFCDKSGVALEARRSSIEGLYGVYMNTATSPA